MGSCIHPKVKVSGVPYDVDAGISGLIERIASHGIMTIDSCEHFGGNSIFLCFATALDLQRFLFVLFPNGIDQNNPLHDRVISRQHEQPDDWHYLASVTKIEDPDNPGTNKVILDASIVLPFSDYGELMRRL